MQIVATLREVIDGMDRNVALCLRNIDSLRESRTWREPGDKREEFRRVTVNPPTEGWKKSNADEQLHHETERLIRRFGDERLHWMRERDWWRKLLEENPDAANRLAHEVLGIQIPQGIARGEAAEPGSAG